MTANEKVSDTENFEEATKESGELPEEFGGLSLSDVVKDFEPVNFGKLLLAISEVLSQRGQKNLVGGELRHND